MLRITAGKFKGKLLDLPPQKLTRPSSDRLRQAVFNILTNQINFNGITVLDAFAGSGSLGLEALSRGAAHVVFCEKDLKVKKTLQKNVLETLKNKVDLASLHSNLFELKQATLFNLIFLDPPYDQSLEIDAIEHLYKNVLLAPNAIIVIEQRKNSPAMILNNFITLPPRSYGNCQVQFLIYNNLDTTTGC